MAKDFSNLFSENKKKKLKHLNTHLSFKYTDPGAKAPLHRRPILVLRSATCSAVHASGHDTSPL
eukprot:scaffold190060_cov13-Tisochrysis_lutea.AAC.1